MLVLASAAGALGAAITADALVAIIAAVASTVVWVVACLRTRVILLEEDLVVVNRWRTARLRRADVQFRSGLFARGFFAGGKAFAVIVAEREREITAIEVTAAFNRGQRDATIRALGLSGVELRRYRDGTI